MLDTRHSKTRGTPKPGHGPVKTARTFRRRGTATPTAGRPATPAAAPASPGQTMPGLGPLPACDLGFGRIVASEIEAPNMLAIPV
jgi:hypothetical protein